MTQAASTTSRVLTPLKGKLIRVAGAGVLVVITALSMELNILNPASGGSWSILLWSAATIVWAVGAVRNHPVQSSRDIVVFATVAVAVSLLVGRGTAGGMILLVGAGIGMLLSALGKAAVVPNPYRNRVCRLLMGIAGMTMLAHVMRVVYFGVISSP